MSSLRHDFDDSAPVDKPYPLPKGEDVAQVRVLGEKVKVVVGSVTNPFVRGTAGETVLDPDSADASEGAT